MVKFMLRKLIILSIFTNNIINGSFDSLNCEECLEAGGRYCLKDGNMTAGSCCDLKELSRECIEQR